MAEPNTHKTKASVTQFIAPAEAETRRKDAKAVDKLMREVSGEKPAMWGATIVGYGQWVNNNTLGAAPWPKIGFSPRKANLVLYVLSESKECAALLKKLGKHKTGKSCLYINKLADVNEDVLRDLVAQSWNEMTKKYG